MSKILVTGGSGQVGKELQKILPDATYISSKDCNLADEGNVISLMTNTKYNTVIHLAAKVGGIIDNIKKPHDYFIENIKMNTNIIDWSLVTGVERFIGILSTCIYPDVMDTYPMLEEDLHSGPPTPTNFSYGYAKRCMAVQIDACNKQFDTKYNYITPSNLYGEYDKFGSNSHFIAALVNKIIDAEKNNKKEIKLFGTGKPLRQFMHAEDLANIIAIMILDNIYENFNIAPEELFSINDMAKIALEITGHNDWTISYDKSKPDGQYRKDVSIKKFRKYFSNYEFIKLEDGIKRVYNYLKKR